MTFTTIVPQSFATTVGSLVQYSGAMQSMTNFMPGVDGAEAMSGNAAPLVNLNGTDQGIDARESFSRLQTTISNMNRGVSKLHRTMSMIPRPYRETDDKAREDKGRIETDRDGMAPGFSNERSHLQNLINMHVAADASASLYVESGDRRKSANFLSRLGLITGKTATELTGSMSDFGVRDWIDGFERMGMRTFAVLKGMADRKLSENGPLMSGSPADIAQRLFEQGILFNAIEDVDVYAKQLMEEKFVGATQLFEQAELFGGAAISSDQAARVWDKLNPADDGDSADGGYTTKNPHASETARLLHRSIEHDPEMVTFGIRYLLGLHYADRAADWAAKQRLFGASVAYYLHHEHKREVMQASIREAHAFARRTDVDSASRGDWETIDGHLSLAIESFNGLGTTWYGKDAKIIEDLKKLKVETKRGMVNAG